MTTLPESWRPALDAAASHAAETAPEEACGFIVGSDPRKHQPPRYVRCRNMATDPRRRFAIDPRRYMELVSSGRPPIAIVHSHPNGTIDLSAEDIRGATLPSAAGPVPAFPGVVWIVIATRSARVATAASYRWDATLATFARAWSVELTRSND